MRLTPSMVSSISDRALIFLSTSENDGDCDSSIESWAMMVEVYHLDTGDGAEFVDRN